MRPNRIKYKFTEYSYTHRLFKGMSAVEFRAIASYLDALALTNTRFVVIVSFSTRLGVIDCFVN